jgi:hypothetical protein
MAPGPIARWRPGPTSGGTIVSRTPSCAQKEVYVRSRVPILSCLLAVLLLLDTAASSAKGSDLFPLRRVYVPGETAVANLAPWIRPAVTDWVIVMDPDPLWFGPPHPAPAAVPSSMTERSDGERYLSWVVPSLPFGRYDLRLCPAPCGPEDPRFEPDATMLVADDRSDAPLVRRIEGLLIRRTESRFDMKHKITSLRRAANMLRVTRATAHGIAERQAGVAEELTARLSGMEARSEAQGRSGVARLLAAFGFGISTTLVAVAFVGRRSRRTNRLHPSAREAMTP